MKHIVLITLVISVLITTPSDASRMFNVGPEELVEANGVDIQVLGYSVPSFVDWNNDNLKDLVIGQGGSTPGKVRVYLNVGTESNPQFSTYFYAQSEGIDLTVTASGCLGCFPRVVYWDADDRKDLLVGEATGYIKIFLNTGTDENPTFDGGTRLQVGGPTGNKSNIDVGDRATPSAIDWNSDGKKDLVVGALDGLIHLFINEGTDTEPNFITQTYVKNYGSNLRVPSDRSSPDVLDLDYDGKKDLISGNTNGELLFLNNTGTDENPSFSGYSYVKSNGVKIDLPGTPRSRPFLCDWTYDAYPDVLIGAGDGKVHLYRGTPDPGDMDADGDVDFYDFAEFTLYWQEINCGQCGGADLANNDGKVDMDDLSVFIAHWLTILE